MSLLFEEIPLSPKLELCRANQDQIRNQRPRLRRNKLFLGRQAGGGFPDQLRKATLNRKYLCTILKTLKKILKINN